MGQWNLRWFLVLGSGVKPLLKSTYLQTKKNLHSSIYSYSMRIYCTFTCARQLRSCYHYQKLALAISSKRDRVKYRRHIRVSLRHIPYRLVYIRCVKLRFHCVNNLTVTFFDSSLALVVSAFRFFMIAMVSSKNSVANYCTIYMRNLYFREDDHAGQRYYFLKLIFWPASTKPQALSIEAKTKLITAACRQWACYETRPRCW